MATRAQQSATEIVYDDTPKTATESSNCDSQIDGNVPTHPVEPTSTIEVEATRQTLDDEIDDYIYGMMSKPRIGSAPIARDKNIDKPSMVKFLTNQYFASRIIILFITIILFFLSLCYTFGQVLTVEISDFWCTRHTLAEIREHSRQTNQNGGDSGSCWNSKLNTVSFPKYLCNYNII